MRLPHLYMLAVAAALAVGYLVLPAVLPPRYRVEAHWGGGGVTWFGHPPVVARASAAGLLALMYGGRFAILRGARGRAAACEWFAVLLAAAVPAVWLFAETDWDNQAVSPPSVWVGSPIALLAVPTAGFGYDVARGRRPTARGYAARSAVEVLVLVPAWVVLWVLVVECYLLGWVGP